MPMTQLDTNIDCPHCHHTFKPTLPPQPELPEEIRQAATKQGITPDHGATAKIAVVQGLLTQLRDSIARQFGFTTNLTAENLTWTFTVQVPRTPPPPNDVAIPLPAPAN